MRRYYLAVDGGGSSTQLTLAKSPSERIFSLTTGPTSFKSVGLELAQANLAAGVEQLRSLLAAHDIPLKETYGTWGMSGCDSEQDAQAFRDMLRTCGIDLSQHIVCNDALLPLRAVTPDAGIVVVAGTGSVCLGVDERGCVHRIGGWGYQFSDLGSGCWMGSQLIRESLLYRDGCRAHDLAFEHTLPLLDDAGHLTHADAIARFARIALECEESPTCHAVCEQASDYLAGYAASMARTLKDQVPVNTPLPVVLAGGLFKHDAFYRLVAKKTTLLAPLSRIAIHRADDDFPTRGGINMAMARHERLA